jgi:hypothetical protein
MLMAEATMQGVTLFSKARKRQNDVFELALTYDGIEIRRPNESPRHLSWDRVSEWEIEQRRGGVVLTLRGGGSVTPLVIPHWKVDELDVVLREVTSHTPPVMVPETPARPSAAQATGTVHSFDPAPPFASSPSTRFDDGVPEQFLLPPDLTGAEPPAPEIAPLMWPGEAPLEELPSLSWPSSMSETSPRESAIAEFVLPDEPIATDPTTSNAFLSSALLSPAPTPAPAPTPVSAPVPAAPPPPIVDEVVEPLATDGPVVDVLALVDDVLAEPTVMVEPEVVAPPTQVQPVVAQPVVEQPAVVAQPVVEQPVVEQPVVVESFVAQAEVAAPPLPPLVIPPKEGAPVAPRRSELRSERRLRETARVEKPKVEKPKVERSKVARQFSWGLATTVVLLGVLALAVALVLAQSAGIIHLPFFGNPT